MLDAVLAGAGIERVARIAFAALGAPLAILIPRMRDAVLSADQDESYDPPALDRWALGLVDRRAEAVPDIVAAHAPIRLRDELVGVVAALRQDAAGANNTIEVLRLTAAAVATELALEAVRGETERKLRGSFFEELRTREDLSGPEIVRRAWSLGCDLTRGAVALCAELAVDRPRLVLAIIADEQPAALAEESPGVGVQGLRRVYAALPASGPDSTAAGSVQAATRLSGRLERFGAVGISSFHSDPAELGNALRESELMLEVAQRSGSPVPADLRHGTYKLLVRLLASHPEELADFYNSTIAAMVSYDEQNRTDLVRTLYSYLNANCNMNETAATIFAHRHTIASRLERIRDLTGLDPTRFEDRERLGLGLKVHRLLACDGQGRGGTPLAAAYGRPGA
jgi:sugar diacid utilization regulator